MKCDAWFGRNSLTFYLDDVWLFSEPLPARRVQGTLNSWSSGGAHPSPTCDWSLFPHFPEFKELAFEFERQ